MFELTAAGDPGADLAAAAIASIRSTAAVRAAADAVELRAIGTLAQVRRAQARAEDPRSDDELVDRCTAQEVSLALWLSPVVARDRLELALELLRRRPATFEALRTGAIDLVRARRITDGIRQLPPALADAIEAEVLLPGSVPGLADRRPGRPAGELTPAQLTARLGRLVMRSDPHGAMGRTQLADARRGCTLRALPDGMALLSVTGRAELLGAAFARIDGTARALLAEQESPATGGTGAVGGAGTSGAVATAGAVGAGTSAAHAMAGVDAARGLDQTRVDVLLASILGHSRDLGRVEGVQVTLALVAPAGTVLAGSDAPGELVGYGPVAAPLVRALAADATWLRWVTDPDAGQVTAVGRRRYRPSAAVADLVRARDLMCRFPTCRRSARTCDLDHVTPFPVGDTHESNLLTECRLHHLLKHRSGFRVRIDPDGTATWTTPTGEQVRDDPPRWGPGPGPPADAPALTAAPPWLTAGDPCGTGGTRDPSDPGGTHDPNDPNDPNDPGDTRDPSDPSDRRDAADPPF